MTSAFSSFKLRPAEKEIKEILSKYKNPQSDWLEPFVSTKFSAPKWKHFSLDQRVGVS